MKLPIIQMDGTIPQVPLFLRPTIVPKTTIQEKISQPPMTAEQEAVEALQLHLKNTGGFDLNIVDVWKDYDGTGVRVGVFDSGFDIKHRDADYTQSIVDHDELQPTKWAITDGDPD